jgi:hypothetical protein
MRRSSMLKKFNGAIVELVRPVISAKEADARQLSLTGVNYAQNPAEAPLRCRQTKGERDAISHARCPMNR